MKSFSFNIFKFLKFLFIIHGRYIVYKENKLSVSLLKYSFAGLSMNILHVGNKSPVQRGFFKNNSGNLLPTLRFLGGL